MSVVSMAESLGQVGSALGATKSQADDMLGAAASLQGDADGLMDQLSAFVVG
jgi:hypothetical protein